MTIRGTIGIGGALLAAAMALHGAQGGAAQQSREAAPRPVKTVKVEARPTQIRRVYPAVVLPGRQVTLSFRVSGRIVELPIRGALRVEAGDLIAALDERDFRTELARLESQLDQARAQLRVLTSGARAEDVAAARAEVAAARAQFEAAAAAAERARALFERGVATRVARDRALTDLQVAEAALEAKSQLLLKSRAGARADEVVAQEAAIEGLELAVAGARAKLDDARLRAPFGGIVARRLVENFANVQAKEPIATLHEIDTLSLSFDVPGPDVVALAGRRPLSTVAVLDSLPGREFEAGLEEFSTEADPATLTYRGRVTIRADRGALVLPGMVGRIVVTGGGKGPPEIAVPLSALVSDADGTLFVWVVTGEESRATRRAVSVGDARGSDVVVREGLAEGDVVVSAGASKLREGMRVRPVAAVGG